MRSKLEPAKWPSDTGQRITWFDRCQLTRTWISNITDVRCKPRPACLGRPIGWSMAAMFCDFVVVVLCTCPRAIPLAMMTTRKEIHRFYEYGAPLGGAPLLFLIIPGNLPVSAIPGGYKNSHFKPPREHLCNARGNIIYHFTVAYSVSWPFVVQIKLFLC